MQTGFKAIAAATGYSNSAVTTAIAYARPLKIQRGKRDSIQYRNHHS
jgi:hypothetical protein